MAYGSHPTTGSHTHEARVAHGERVRSVRSLGHRDVLHVASPLISASENTKEFAIFAQSGQHSAISAVVTTGATVWFSRACSGYRTKRANRNDSGTLVERFSSSVTLEQARSSRISVRLIRYIRGSCSLSHCWPSSLLRGRAPGGGK